MISACALQLSFGMGSEDAGEAGVARVGVLALQSQVRIRHHHAEHEMRHNADPVAGLREPREKSGHAGEISKYIARPNTAPTSDAMPALESKLNRTMIRLKIRLGTLTIADALLRQKPGGRGYALGFRLLHHMAHAFVCWRSYLAALIATKHSTV
jgi:hypothetical protein